MAAKPPAGWSGRGSPPLTAAPLSPLCWWLGPKCCSRAGWAGTGRALPAPAPSQHPLPPSTTNAASQGISCAVVLGDASPQQLGAHRSHRDADETPKDPTRLPLPPRAPRGGTDLGSRSEAACCPVPSACRRSPAPRHPRTSSTRCCRGTAGAGTGPPRRTGARARRPRARVLAAPPAGTAARAGRGSAAACSLPLPREPKQQQSEDGGSHLRQSRRDGEPGSLTVRALEAIALVTRLAPAGEGARRVVAGGGWVTWVFGTLIHVCA